jgi:cyclopropane fatty-acyl-phospholipid synthase-like methyltransferase
MKFAVLELVSGLGNSAIALAKRYNIQVIGIECDEKSDFVVIYTAPCL